MFGIVFLFLTFSFIMYFYFEILELIEDLLYDYFSINYLSLTYILQIVLLLLFLFSFFYTNLIFSVSMLFAVLFVLFDDFFILEEVDAEINI